MENCRIGASKFTSQVFQYYSTISDKKHTFSDGFHSFLTNFVSVGLGLASPMFQTPPHITSSRTPAYVTEVVEWKSFLFSHGVEYFWYHHPYLVNQFNTITHISYLGEKNIFKYIWSLNIRNDEWTLYICETRTFILY